MAAKSYLDLKKEVWDTGICSGCGACVAVCPADSIFFENGEMVVSPKSNGYCKQATDGVLCGACYAACPRIGTQPREPLGAYLEIVSGQTTMDVPHRQSGGAVTAILAKALDDGLIDAVITITEDHWTLKPSSVIITQSDVLIHQAGSRYSWWVPLLAALKTAVVEKKYRRIAVVGVPCVVQAIARMRESDNDLLKPYGNAIRLVLGLFCTETFDYSLLVNGKLRQHYKLEPYQIQKLDVKGKLDITRQDGSHMTVPLAELETCIRGGCKVCTDLTSVNADISAGSIGSPAGYTTLVIRTLTGKGFVEHAVQAHALVLTRDVDVAAIEKLGGAKIRKNSP